MKDFTVIFNGEIYKVKAKYLTHLADVVLFYDDNDKLVASAPVSALIF
jgi:sporulation protein YlmC with PRC-barrel domain